MAKKKTTKNGINKAQAVRDFLTANPEAKPNDAAKALSKKHRVVITPAYVSQTKLKMKPNLKAAKKNSTTNALTIEQLRLTRDFVLEIGGVAEAHDAIRELQQFFRAANK